MDKSKLSALLTACIMLSGCAASDESSPLESNMDSESSSVTNTELSEKDSPDNGSAVSEAKYDNVSGCLPVIDIRTKKEGKGSLDFVTKPTARHVSESIASWQAGYTIPPEPFYEECSITVSDAEHKLLLENADAEVKVRGNWTTAYNKKPLRIKFAEKHGMLGLGDGEEYKNWVLLAEYKDFSMLRNKTGLMLGSEILGSDGYYSSDSQLAEVRINGEYWGVYLLAEHQQAGKGRVDITKPEKDQTSTDIGYFIEYNDQYYSEDALERFRVNYHSNALLTPYDGKGGSGRTAHPFANGRKDIGFTIKSDIYSQEQHDTIPKFANNAYNIMYEAAYNDKAFVMTDDYTDIVETTELTPQQAVEKAVDVRSLVDSYIVAELTCDADIYLTSFFMDVDLGKDGSGKLTFEAPWDFDSALGNKDRCADGTGYYASNLITDVNGQGLDMSNPWLMVLQYEDWFREMIYDRWTEIYDNGTFDRVYEMISSESEKYEKAFELNYEKWDNIRNNGASNELCRAAAACKSEKEAADYLHSWLTSRVEFLNSEWHR